MKESEVSGDIKGIELMRGQVYVKYITSYGHSYHRNPDRQLGDVKQLTAAPPTTAFTPQYAQRVKDSTKQQGSRQKSQ